MLCGGFPCQAFSIAGKRRGFEDIRGTMFFEVARILKVKRPKIVFLENVKGLLNHNKGETFRVILQTLDELGYEVQWMVLNSKFFGVPQNRERVFIIGNLRGERRPEILPFREINSQDNELCGHETITNTVHARITADSNGVYMEGRGPPQINVEGMLTGDGWEKRNESIRKSYVKAVLTPDRAEKRQNGRRFKEDGEPSFTLTGQDVHGVQITYPTLSTELAHSTGRDFFRGAGQKIYQTSGQIRRLTPTECCRLQGFPDDWNEWGIDDKGNKVKMSDTQRYKQMGNAVTVNVVQAIGKQLLHNESK